MSRPDLGCTAGAVSQLRRRKGERSGIDHVQASALPSGNTARAGARLARHAWIPRPGSRSGADARGRHRPACPTAPSPRPPGASSTTATAATPNDNQTSRSPTPAPAAAKTAATSHALEWKTDDSSQAPAGALRTAGAAVRPAHRAVLLPLFRCRSCLNSPARWSRGREVIGARRRCHTTRRWSGPAVLVRVAPGT